MRLAAAHGSETLDIRRRPVAVAAGLGSIGARKAQQTYEQLQKPGWAPPATAFGPAWTALYAGIGTAGWRLPGRASRRARSLHLAQLGLNTAWPLALFSARDKRAALAIIAALDVTIAAEILSLRSDDRVAPHC